jgi:hypothetical protein
MFSVSNPMMDMLVGCLHTTTLSLVTKRLRFCIRPAGRESPVIVPTLNHAWQEFVDYACNLLYNLLSLPDWIHSYIAIPHTMVLIYDMFQTESNSGLRTNKNSRGKHG